jgi:uncharacterized surface protein with fasciclin (FAS1) repeats
MSVLLNAGLALGIGAVLASSVAFAAEKDAKMDIVDTAVKAGSFKTLAAALKAAGLLDTLKGLRKIASWHRRDAPEAGE